MHMHACTGTFAVWGCKKHRIPTVRPLLCVIGEQLPLSELPPSQEKKKKEPGFEGSAVGARTAEERMES